MLQKHATKSWLCRKHVIYQQHCYLLPEVLTFKHSFILEAWHSCPTRLLPDTQNCGLRAVMRVGIAYPPWWGNVPGIPGACANYNFTYLARSPWTSCDTEMVHLIAIRFCRRQGTPWPLRANYDINTVATDASAPCVARTAAVKVLAIFSRDVPSCNTSRVPVVLLTACTHWSSITMPCKNKGNQHYKVIGKYL